ncbi:hypothetical protein [Azospirillum brasilense]|uniref:hypothetical protein n=1 Tax=Azospirillum brasilense TaxID=192 RepID=UPI000E6922D4|nr:hypothetical protein [Azospirillum brasilense]NUB25753.1 hypothetical protein [Azospirillum brasilense]NUB33891.1 hypothetical protein [Azospirillum brasilense]RIW07737.1 hypothetical protein D2T81_02545 [Azospirillum brasilense]
MPGRRYFPCPRWTAGQKRRAERDHLAGKVEAVTAPTIGRSVAAVRTKIARMGLPKAPADSRQGLLIADGGPASPSTSTPERRS